MNLNIKIDKNSNTPAYRQIIEQITSGIKDGKLSYGDKLLPERDLAKALGLARGTVKTAYAKLASSNIIEMTQGRGSFISSGQDILNEGRKEKAVRLIRAMLSELHKLKFAPREISSMFQILLMEHEQERENIHIAGIDCNPEALSIFDRQLRYISNVQLYRFLLDDLYRDGDMKNKLSEFDLLLTTSTHYAEILGVIPEIKEKLVQVVVSPSQQTIIDLAKIPVSSKIGIITQSRNFLKIIKNKLNDFQISPKNIKHIFEEDSEKFPEFIKDRDVLITPPACLLEGRREFQTYFQRFTGSGGVIIRFDYQIERSALMHIEEKISKLVKDARH